MNMKQHTVAVLAFITGWTAPTLVRAASFSGKVVRVSEGDTIDVMRGTQVERIRLYGIDAPKKGQTHAAEAKAACATMCSGKVVTIEVKGRNAKGHTVGHVILPGGKSLNRALVWCGDAWWDRPAAPGDRNFAVCEADAKKAMRGLWANPNPVAPWQWKSTAPPKSGPRPAPPSAPKTTSRRPSPPPRPAVRSPAAPTTVANFAGNWTCVWGKDTIPGALTQNGTSLKGYCIYPGGKRATFSGTVSGNTMSGTLYVDSRTRRAIRATLNGNTMSGTWDGGNEWMATRR